MVVKVSQKLFNTNYLMLFFYFENALNSEEKDIIVSNEFVLIRL